MRSVYSMARACATRSVDARLARDRPAPGQPLGEGAVGSQGQAFRGEGGGEGRVAGARGRLEQAEVGQVAVRVAAAEAVALAAHGAQEGDGARGLVAPEGLDGEGGGPA